MNTKFLVTALSLLLLILPILLAISFPFPVSLIAVPVLGVLIYIVVNTWRKE